MPSGGSGERKARIREITLATGKCGYCPFHGGENASRSEKHGGKRKDKK